MLSLHRLKHSRAARNAAASYFAFFSVSLSSFVSIPIVVHFLDKEQIGLWAVINQVVGYLLWMDLGVGNAAGRKMANAVTANNQLEINRWWTAIVVSLSILGVIVICLGLLIAPLAISWLKIPHSHQGDAWYLYLGSLMITGLSFPIKGAPGLLTVQERFHWCPIGQAIMPWVSLIIFYLSLLNGFGVRSYVWSLAASQLFVWIYYFMLVSSGPQSPSLDRSGLTMRRFKSLFGYSLSLSVLSFVEALLQSLPAIILSRSGGLAQVPVYLFTARGPLMATSLVRRTTHAFYPGLLKLYVSGNREAFKKKYKQIGLLTLAVGTIASGIVFMGNRMLVEFLAGSDFYAGHATNLWLVALVLTGPLCALFEILLQISGSMGRSALVAPLKLVLAGFGAFILYRYYGMAGLAAVFAFAPFFYGLYSYFQGSLNCGYKPKKLARPLMLVGLLLLALVIACGSIVLSIPAPGLEFQITSHTFRLAGTGEILACFVLILFGTVLGTRQVLKILGK